MCAIAGIFRPGQHADPALVRAMTDALAHRGPDDAGLEVLANGQLAFGHRRLAILDLTSLGHQPMAHPNGAVWIVFNGEVYNFRELRAELSAEGETFRSETDTEVVLAAYVRWGMKGINRFRGMFAFALWDARLDKLFLVRDRFGVKPLYYAAGDKCFTFASELRGILAGSASNRAVRAESAAEFLRFGYVSAPSSIFSDVATVPPGSVVSIDTSLAISIESYWSPTSIFDSDEMGDLRLQLAALDEDALLDRVEDALTEAFSLRMIADVPVGLFLSGGIDSSLVATLLARRRGMRLRTYTIGYSGSEFDETPYARAVANELGSDHMEIAVSKDMVFDLFERIPEVFDEPMGDSSAIPTLLVCKLAREHVTVALSADGADELFGGYARYEVCGGFADSINSWMRLGYVASAELLDLLPANLITWLYALSRRDGAKYAAIGDKVRKFVRMTRSRSTLSAYESAISEWTRNEACSLLASAPSRQATLADLFKPAIPSDPREQFMHLDTSRYLVGDLLTKVDRTSMSVSLEAREPFLDHQMAALAAALPLHWKIRGGQSKYILRKLLARHLKADFFDRPKQGFSAPVGDWMRGVLRPQIEDALSSENLRRTGMLDPLAVQVFTSQFMLGKRNVSAAGLWHILQLQSWSARWGRDVVGGGR